ncbi:MAG TPA: hypothetical protein VM891_02220 [Amaricoccus sp.]|nr:hypothetical protein [Amaricoccus sp.]
MSQRTWMWIIGLIVVILAIYFVIGSNQPDPVPAEAPAAAPAAVPAEAPAAAPAEAPAEAPAAPASN